MGLKDLLVRIRADNSELDKAVIESSRRMEQVGKRLDRMGRSLSLNVTAPILALGGASIASSIKFEDAMAGVAKTVDASAETITALGDEFKALSEQIPVAATELANIGEAAGQLGIATNNILSFTRVMADLGVATNLTSEEAATDLARLANITQMPQDQFDRLGSTVVALGNNLATTEQEIVAMGLRLAGAGTQIGLTEDQILALAGSLSSVGIEAESGGTALSKVMAEMAIAVGDGSEKLEQFARIAGMSGAEFAEVFETDAADALVTFIEGLGRLSDEGVNVFQVLESVEFGNIRVRDALLRASGAGDLMRSSLDLGSTAWRENTALTIEAAKFNATTGNQLKIAWNQIRNMAAELGDNLTPALLAMVEAAKPVLEVLGNMIKGFGELPKSIQTATIGLVGLTTVLGPAAVAISRITTALGMLRGAAALGGLSAMLGPGAPILAGLALLAGGFLLAKKGADDASEAVAGLADSQRSLTGTMLDLTEAQIIMQTAEALDREAEARRKLADAERELGAAKALGVERPFLPLQQIEQFNAEIEQAAKDIERLTDAFNKSQSSSGGATGGDATGGDATGGDATVSTDAQTLLDKQATLAKQLQDEMVAMTKTAVDDMQLEYDRLEAHIIEVDGAISASWQKVLDGRQADIAAVGLAEQFPALAIIEDMEKAVAKADQLEASLGRGFDLVSAKVGIFRSALEEMIDLGLGPANEEYEKTLDGLKRLLIVQGKMAEGVADLSTELSFFEGLKDQAKGILDPSAIASSALGNLLSGGVSSIVSSLFSGIGGLFRGPDETALDRNSEALIELQTGLRELSDALFRSTPGGLISGLQEGLTAAFAVIDERNVRNPTEAGVDLINQTMADLGLTFEETRELALGFGIELEKSVPSFRQFLDALREADLGKFFDGFSGQMNLAQRRFDLFDIQAPAEKLSVLQDLFERFTNLPAPTNTEALLELFEQFASGGIKFGDLDKLTGSQFLDMLSDMEGLFDDLGDSAKGANAALRNVPAGFKVAAARFRATDPESFAPPEPPPILPPITPPPPLPPDDALREIMDALTGSGGVGDTITDALAGLNDLGTVKDALAGGLNDSSGLGTMKDMLAGRLNDSSGLAGGNMTDRLGLGGGASDQPVTNNYIFQGDINLPDVQDPDEFLLQIEQQARWRGRTGGGVLETNEQR